MLGRRPNPAEDEPQQPEGGSLWEDPEDHRVEVDMSQEARLRKVMRASNKTKVDGVEYQNLMKEHFQKRTKDLNYMAWADESQAMETTITARSGISRIDTILNKDSGAAKDNVAPEDMILIRKIAETNHSDRLDSVVQSLSAHPNKHDVVLASGFDKTLRLFKLGWDTSNEVALMECEHKAFIKDFPIKQAHFSDATTAVVCAVASPNLVFYDIEKQKPQTIAGLFAHKGQDRKDKFIQGIQMGSVGTLTCAYSSGSLGTIGFLDSRSKQRLFELNMNEGCQDVVFRSDDTELVSSGDKGHIYIWDLRKRSLLTKVKDLGSQSTSALACHNDRVFTGSRAGIVNIYNLSTKEVVTNFNANPQPTKRFDNLTTEISETHTSQTAESIGTEQWILDRSPQCQYLQTARSCCLPRSGRRTA